MSSNLDAVTAEALKLSAEERAELAGRLIASVEPPLPLHPEWEAEIARRVADLDSGRSQPIPAEQVFSELRTAIDSHRGM